MRALPSWIEGFMQYTEHLPSPEIYRRWSAVSAISSALERKVWVSPLGPPLYPNTYIILVGPPGVGKSVVTSQVQYLLREVDGLHLASSSLTKAALIDELKEAARTIVRLNENPPTYEFHYLSILANELGVLIPAYENEFMSALTDVWDGHGYSERRRSKDIKISMPAAQFNILAGTTPSYLSSTLPPGAWDQGFLSRTTIVFSGETNIKPLFQKEVVNGTAFDKLVKDLSAISMMFGKMLFTETAAELISNWHMEGGPPKPDHPKLASYCTRRTSHLCKLCMIMSAAESDELLITEEHFIQALDLMVETEAYIPEVFKAMNQGGDKQAMEDCFYFASKIWMKNKKPVPVRLLIEFLAARVPSYAVLKILEVMEKAGLLQKRLEPDVGDCYLPRQLKD